MTSTSSLRVCAAPAAVVLVTAMLGMPLLAGAQQATVQAEAAETMEAPHPIEASVRPSERRNIGDATHSLLALQREGHAASPTPRPLAGDVATLSYQRYLESFKFPIPEKFSAAVQKSGGSGGGTR